MLPSRSLALATVGLLVVAGSVRADEAPGSRPGAPPANPTGARPAVPAAADASVRTFATREEAAHAMVEAFERNDDAALRSLVGADAADLVQAGQDDAARRQRAALAASARRRLGFEEQPDGRVLVTVGETEYPLALPLVRADGRWRVDAAAGRQELLARRIGEHEVEAIGVCLAFADAQAEYASKDRDGDRVKEYAQRLRSTPGTRDGLYWEGGDADDVSPIGPDLAPLRDALEPSASAADAPRAPFNGYYWRILTEQGGNAPGGAHSYVINGNMIAGFALLAVPAEHRNTGVKSFLVSHHGQVLEKDLGPDTMRLAAAITAYDPDASWREVDEATLRVAAASSPDDAPFLEGSGGPTPAMETGGAALPMRGHRMPPMGGHPCPQPQPGTPPLR